MFGRPFFVVATGQAMRSFRDEVMRKTEGNDIANHPSDFALYHLADFDDAVGQVMAENAPILLVRGKDVAEIVKES
jgi:hypothetical protein